MKASFAKWLSVLAGVLIFGLGGYLSTGNYLLYHTFTEMFTIIVSFSIVLIVFNSRKILKNDFIPIIGIAYAFAGIFDLLHTLAYEGLGVFPNAGTDLAPQMWIIARYLDSIGMLLAGISFIRAIKPQRIFYGYTLASILALLAVFYWDVFPVCFIDGEGLTPFKIYSEYIISLLLAASVFLLVRHKNHFYPKVYSLLLVFFVASVGTELSFTFYTFMYGWQNMIGHLFKITAFFFLYRAIVETSLKEPFNLLFFQLNKAYNRLEHSTVELAEKNAELMAFAGIISHDLRAPLVNIRGFSQELNYSLAELERIICNVASQLTERSRRELDTLLEKDVPEALSYINSSIDRMDRMTAALLKLSRIGRREIVYRDIDMNELVQGVVQTFNHQLEQNAIRVEVSTLPHVNSDHLAVEQIVGNLLDNAIKYLQPGRPGKIRIYGSRSGEQISFSVEDNGRGIAAEDQEKIFDVFQRVGKADVPGEGMGLAYVKMLIRQLGGKVYSQSRPEVGTTITFSLPEVNPATGRDDDQAVAFEGWRSYSAAEGQSARISADS